MRSGKTLWLCTDCKYVALTQDNSEPGKLNERFEERAAIMEFEGGLSREEAEHKAAEIHCRYHRWVPLRGLEEIRKAFPDTPIFESPEAYNAWLEEKP